jgi:uncharacterized repeat protein (TIGR01451 family)
LDPISVTVTSGSRAPVTLTVGANATISVLWETMWFDLAEGNQGTFLSSEDEFWGVSVIDSATVQGTGDDWDWGYSLVPESELSSQLIVGHAPGKPAGVGEIPDDNGNLAFVVAVTDTVLYVDLDQDGRPDPFDMDGDGDYRGQDMWGEPEWDECVSAFGVPMSAGQVMRVGDPFDRNLEGARIFTAGLGEHIAGAWGQDPIRADASSYLDLGYTLLPLVVPRVFKTDGMGLDAAYLPGEVVTYTILVENNGMASMSDVVLMDTLPYTYTDLVDSVQVTTPPPTGSVEYHDGTQWLPAPSSGTQQLRVTWPEIEPQQTVTVTLQVRVDPGIPTSAGDVCNYARVTSASTDPVDSQVCRPVRRPQLAISKAVFPADLYPGETVTYTIVVSNSGDGLAVPTVISDQLPLGVEYLPGTLDVTWLAPQVEIMTRTVTQTNVFHGHYADDFDLGPGESTGYGGSDGSLAWTGDWGEVNDDDDSGGGTVQVMVDAPNALSEPAFAWLGAPSGADSGLVRTLDLTLFISPSLRYYPAGSAGIGGNDEYQVTASGDVLLTEMYTDTYCVHELGLEDYAGQSDVALGWLATTGMDTGDFYRLDHISVYDKQPERISQRVLSNEVISYALRALSGQDPLSYDSLSGQMVLTESLSLPVGGTFTATFQALVTAVPPPAGSLWLTNTSCVTTTTWLEDVPTPPCDDAPIRVVQQADLTLVKTDQPDEYVLNGEVLTYTLAYRNLGGEEVQDVVLTDTLPAEVTFGGVVAQPPGWSAPPAHDPVPPETLTWTVPTLGAGASGQIVYTVTVSSEYSGTMTNRACISTETPEEDYGNNCDQEDTRVTPEIVDLGIVKTDDPEPGVPGGPLTYTIEYVNNGPFDAREVYITDTFPLVGLTFVRVLEQPPGWVGPDYSAGPPIELTWYTPTLVVGASGRIVYEVLAAEDVPGEIVNTACISSTLADYDDSNNCDEEPTAVELYFFRARRLPQAILLHWETAWEVDSFEFLLLRSASGRLDDAREIASLPARGRGGGGAVYGYLDHGPQGGFESGTAYSYWLVEVDTSGRRTTYGTTVSAADTEYDHQSHLPFLVWR